MVAIFLAVVAFAVSILTFFAGFGLGTLLMPAFALFLAPALAVACTAIVHFLNNVFKVTLLARQARRDVVIRFGIPAVIAAAAGAAVLSALAGDAPIATWSLGGRRAEITVVKLVLGALIVVFGLFELVPRLQRWRAPVAWLPLGGVLAGFFGGLSGHQGALRAAFLAPLGMKPAEFVATQSVLGLMVDAVRIAVYALTFLSGRTNAAADTAIPWGLVAAATGGAFAGVVVGRAALAKVTIERLQLTIGVLLIAVGLALGAGVI